MRRLGWLAFVLGCGLLAACGDGRPNPETDQGIPDGDLPVDADQGLGITLEVGFGETGSFMVAPGSGTATAVRGLQGGYHVDIGFRVRGLSQAEINSRLWTIAYAFRSASGVTLSEPFARILSEADVRFDGVGQVRTGDRVVFASSIDPSVHSMTTITLEVVLTSGRMRVADTAEVTLVVP